MNLILALLIFIISYIVDHALCSVVSGKKNKPLVIAHRGASGYLPEHTFQAKSMAYAMGSDYLEQDLVLTKDYIPIVLHDIYIDTVTDVETKFSSYARKDGRYYAIDFTLEQIKTLKVSERFQQTPPHDVIYPKRFPKWNSKFEISTFREEIELVLGLQKSLKQSANLNNKVVGIYPEIKQPFFHMEEGYKNFSEIVLQILKEYNYTKSTDPVFLQCFDPFELIDTESDDRINYTYWGSEEGLKNISKFAQGIGPEKTLLIELDSNKKYLKPSSMVTNARKFDLALHPYTFRVDSLPPYVKDHDELMKIFVDEIEVDGLFSDFPDLVVKYISESNKSKKIALNSLLIFFLICISLIFKI